MCESGEGVCMGERKRQFRQLLYLFIFPSIVSLGVLTGCRTSGDELLTDESLYPPVEQRWPDGNYPWVTQKFPGPDSTVPAELGGPGFEKIADSLGFITYQPTEEEIRFFGDPRAKEGGVFRIITSRFPATMRIYGENSNYIENSYIEGLCYETLLDVHPVTLEFMPKLASHWKISDDKLEFTFRIDPQAHFSNGKPVTAEDVVATWRLIMDETIRFPSHQLVFGKFEEPQVVSKYMVKVRCKKLNWRNLLYFGAAMPILSAEEIGRITGREYLEQFQFNMSVGSGEYIILPEDIRKEQGWTLTRRPDYWAKNKPWNRYTGNFDYIVFDVVKDNISLMYEKFKKGESDIFTFGSATIEQWVTDTNYTALKNGWVRKRWVYNDHPAGTNGYAFNMRTEPFNDIRVRKAFAYLHNRPVIIEKLLYNEYLPLHSYYANTVYENPNNPRYDYNPEKAAQLLAEAGWKERNEQGILVKDGKPFVIEFGIPKVIEKFVTPYKQELRKAGIDLRLKYQDGNTLWKNAMQRNFKLYFISWSGLVFPNPETSLHSSLADKPNNNNLEGFKSPAVDSLLEIYDTTFSQQKRIEIIQQIDKIVMDSCKNALGWYPKALKFAYWNKFGMPEYAVSRFGDPLSSAMSLWWYDKEKAEALQAAIKEQRAIPDPGPKHIRFWKEFANRATELQE